MQKSYEKEPQRYAVNIDGRHIRSFKEASDAVGLAGKLGLSKKPGGRVYIIDRLKPAGVRS